MVAIQARLFGTFRLKVGYEPRIKFLEFHE